jgi:hypothetical protein
MAFNFTVMSHRKLGRSVMLSGRETALSVFVVQMRLSWRR